ncbi:hypothetical protein SAMN04488030_1948 [Aliiroseovarius halocynthiae]|uniref:Uncharacterized protein n=1 Tax=Aliiroseovarius halocynthiae TaxID=985055 RepID=A0A545SR63_9RHOB|nr:hypothetical protein [Aliiroseovarius halocynthiae]TQV67473.1 hypothetical protein FIL88_09615 [Aliiroseovarius halocynthiae]SMR81481.1 hypothetical protein SAMN04488030_1948 [Aliiroseovarius halocynthiae]
MNKIKVGYLYALGQSTADILKLQTGQDAGGQPQTCDEVRAIVQDAMKGVEEFVASSVEQLPNLEAVSVELYSRMQKLLQFCMRDGAGATPPTPELVVDVRDCYMAFQAELEATLSEAEIFIVDQKSAFDTSILIERGHLAFPASVTGKAPDAVTDLDQAMRCIAFDMPTAAAFHLHRAHAIVLGVYWDAIAKGAKRPAAPSLEAYLKEMKGKEIGNETVTLRLKEIAAQETDPSVDGGKDLDDIEDALELYTTMRSSIAAMLKDLPTASRAGLRMASVS